jgi:hypothetical protein
MTEMKRRDVFAAVRAMRRAGTLYRIEELDGMWAVFRYDRWGFKKFMRASASIQDAVRSLPKECH